jgi:alpha-beta hydrolase superfamily lysophospholipase
MISTLTTADGVALHVHAWPTDAPGLGTVLIVHGLGEHIGRYARVASHLDARGWNVVGYDHRGHGRSGGAKGRLAERNDLLRDLALVIDAVRARQPDTLMLLGHSLGGLIAARFVAEGLADAPAPWWRKVDGLVLSSPALDPGMNAVQKLLLAVAGPLAPDLAIGNGVKPAWISREAAVVQAYQDDPLVHDRVTPRLAGFIVDAGAHVLAAAPRWSLPTLLMYAGNDRCVAPRGSAAFAAAAPKAVVQAREFRRLYHEIFNEPEHAEVFAVLDAWLAAPHVDGVIRQAL